MTACPALRPLRDYQQKAVDDTRALVREGVKRIVLVAPTGSGKSLCLSHIAAQRVARGGDVLVLTHRRELVRQAAGHLAADGLTDVRIFLGGSSVGNENARIAVASVGTLASDKWANHPPRADLVIVDECHHVVASQHAAVLARYPEAIHLGFTATPERHDGSPLCDFYERMIVVESIRGLTRAKWLVPCVVIGPTVEQNQLADDAAHAYLEKGEGKRAIIFCANVVHSRGVAERLKDAGVPSEHVDGTMGQRTRDAILNRFASGETRVLSNVNLVSEGFDVPACKCVVMARGCDSAALYLQAIGRELRPEHGEDYAIFIDLRGAVYKHGMPDDERVFSLEGKAIARADQGDAPAIRQCLHCGKVFRYRPVCPYCGQACPPPKDPAIKRAAMERISQAHTIDQRMSYLQKLAGECRLNGYKPGRAAVKYKARYHHWPTRGQMRQAFEAVQGRPDEHAPAEDL